MACIYSSCSWVFQGFSASLLELFGVGPGHCWRRLWILDRIAEGNPFVQWSSRVVRLIPWLEALRWTWPNYNTPLWLFSESLRALNLSSHYLSRPVAWQILTGFSLTFEVSYPDWNTSPAFVLIFTMSLCSPHVCNKSFKKLLETFVSDIFRHCTIPVLF